MKFVCRSGQVIVKSFATPPHSGMLNDSAKKIELIAKQARAAVQGGFDNKS